MKTIAVDAAAAKVFIFSQNRTSPQVHAASFPLQKMTWEQGTETEVTVPSPAAIRVPSVVKPQALNPKDHARGNADSVLELTKSKAQGSIRQSSGSHHSQGPERRW